MLIAAALAGLALALYAGLVVGHPSAAAPSAMVAPPMVAAGSAFAFCAPCHRPDGKGVPGVFPALVGSHRLLDDPRQAVAIVLAGFDSQGDPAAPRWSSPMPPLAHLPDAVIAEAMNHARSSWGNHAPAITPTLVADLRARCTDRQRPWTPVDLPRASAP